jgi:TolB-like protein
VKATTILTASLFALTNTSYAQSAEINAPKKIAVLPWTFFGGTETAVSTAQQALSKIFSTQRLEVVPEAKVSLAWEQELGRVAPSSVVDSETDFLALPSAKALLELGRKLGVDYVCAGRGRWHTRSVWVGLGPKTKADFTVDTIVVDVKNAEVALEAKGIRSDSTKKEKAWETAGALFLSFGVTALSGGPKTPHQQKAALNAISLAFEPWLRTSSRKISGL